MKYRTELIGKEDIAEGTMLFRFTKPGSFIYDAGQTMDVTLIAPSDTDADGESRSLSIASAPHEPELRVAMRMRDTAFKRSLRDMRLGTTVEIEGPFGALTLTDVTRPVVLLTGGIGATIARSIIAGAVETQHAYPLTLLYSNPTPKGAAFLAEFEGFSRQHPLFTFVPTMTRAVPGEWIGEEGRVTAAKLIAYANLGAKPLFYLSGTPLMVSELRAMLLSLHVPDSDIQMESFAGY